ncbi:hypothetical protein ONS95_011880 [Cadophora gregata]|uniref:uncharacterized protein n=1 Tax=Cadophora gregata TaxID=51156 RepID=UPI0026DC611D|nr:uncharacterized protein ONS95_011880 [Cadophora gregata]KAK0117541.1 hypothetical protein ONS95_011880 [Cadophora gregata]
MPQPLQLIIYIDPRLLQDSSDLGNLCFARKVNGSYNVVFQGTENTDLTAQNNFSWVENYAMGAVLTLADGAHVGGATSVQPIQAGQACTWGPKSADMPIAGPAPPPPDFPAGSFGTVGMPYRYHGAVYSQTGTNPAWTCIYVDANPKPGLDKISYIPKNEYSLFFDAELQTSSLFTRAVSNALQFSIPTNSYSYYVGWGLSSDGKTATWSDYGINDPGHWKPITSLAAFGAITSLGVTIYPDGSTNELEPAYIKRSRAIRGTDASYGAAGSEALFAFRLGWETEHFPSDEEKAYYAKTVASFLSLNCPSSIRLRLQTVSTFCVGYAFLNSIGPDWLILEGEDDAMKAKNMLQNLLADIRTDFAPVQVDWNYKILPSKAVGSGELVEGGEWVQMVMQMGWPAAVGITAASVAAGYVATKVLDVLKNSQIKFEKATISPSGEMLVVKGSYRANQAQVPTTIQQVNNVVAQEALRTAPSPVPGLPTPDQVFLIENMPAPNSSLKRTNSIRTTPKRLDFNGNRTANGYTNGNGFSNGVNGYSNGVKAIYA